MAKKTYVLDTSVYLTDSKAINCYGYNDIVIPLKVLEEIDKHKKRLNAVEDQFHNKKAEVGQLEEELKASKIQV